MLDGMNECMASDDEGAAVSVSEMGSAKVRREEHSTAYVWGAPALCKRSCVQRDGPVKR